MFWTGRMWTMVTISPKLDILLGERNPAVNLYDPAIFSSLNLKGFIKANRWIHSLLTLVPLFTFVPPQWTTLRRHGLYRVKIKMCHFQIQHDLKSDRKQYTVSVAKYEAFFFIFLLIYLFLCYLGGRGC